MSDGGSDTMRVEALTDDHIDRFDPGDRGWQSWTPENTATLRRKHLGRAAAVVGGQGDGATEPGERVLAIFGATVHDGDGHVFLFLDDAARRRPVLLTRWAKRTLAALRDQYGLRRFRAKVPDWSAARWASVLGFAWDETGDEMVKNDG